MIKLGQKVKFDPWHGIHTIAGSADGEEVDGTVVFINPKHHWFEVEYKLGDEKFKTSFHFADVFGKDRKARLVGG